METFFTPRNQMRVVIAALSSIRENKKVFFQKSVVILIYPLAIHFVVILAQENETW